MAVLFEIACFVTNHKPDWRSFEAENKFVDKVKAESAEPGSIKGRKTG